MIDPRRLSASTIATTVTVVSGALFVVLAWALVPWHPIPGGPLSPVSATSVFSPEQIEAAEQFSRWARGWSWSGLAVSVSVASLLGFTRAGSRLVGRLVGPWWIRVPVGVAVLLILGRVATAPFAILQRLHRRENGLSTQSWPGFAGDLLLGLLVSIAVTSLALLAVVACSRRWPRAWTAVAGSAVALLVLVGSYAYPVVIEPLYNSFEPLPAGALRTEILEMAHREGVNVEDVLIADASRRTTTLNAYVSGFGATRRVVVYDNLVEQLPHDEAISVVAHELAHARHRDVLLGSVLGATGAAFAVGLLGLLMAGWARRRSELVLSEPTAVPTVLALVAVATLLSSPIQNTISRQIEIRADVVALRVTRDSDAFVETQRQLSLRSLSDPTPPAWSHFWFGSHPTTLLRIALAERLRGEADD